METIEQQTPILLTSRLGAFLARRPIILQFARFVALGVLNTAIDFILFNFLSKALGVTEGVQLGFINVLGFVVAVIQSYLWNRGWVFEGDESVESRKLKVESWGQPVIGVGLMDVLRAQVWKLIAVGSLGFLSVLLVVIAAKFSATPIVYLIILSVFVVSEVLLWQNFGLSLPVGDANSSRQFTVFVLVSVIGLLLNSVLVSVFSSYIMGADYFTASPDLVKNVAKIGATLLSLIWNFLGYKLIVFRK